MKTKPQPRVGDTGFEVEWTTKLGLVDPDDPSQVHNPDANETRYRIVSSLDAAMALARKVLPKDVYECVRVTPTRFRSYDEADEARYPHVGFWECYGEPTEVTE